MSNRITLDPHPTSVAAAREWSVDRARALGFDDLVDTVELLVSELVTNVVRHAGTAAEVTFAKTRRGLLVEVHDHDPTPPERVEDLDPLSTSGRGLALVEALADSSGTEHNGDGGKIVWFALDSEHPGI